MKRKTTAEASTLDNQPAQENPFSQIGAELAQLEREGTLPEGFDLQAACQDRNFAELVSEYPAKAAIRIYAAEKRAEEAEKNAMEKLAQQLKVRNSLPRSQKGGGNVSSAPDYMSMSSEAFRSLENNLKSAARRGGKPII